ncbi:MAG: sulfur carrier protein ThiS adenylyltransferase ThiF [Chitinispirillaceae bacterium]
MFCFDSVSGHFHSSEQLQKIKNSTIGIAGAGGLGSNCALFLARSGFENLVIADFDKVEPSNLNRQVYFPHHIGKPKVECLKNILQTLNPQIRVESHNMKLDESSCGEIFKKCQVVVEAFDRAEAKAMMVHTFLNTPKLLVSASGLGGYGNSDRIITRRVRDNFFLIGDLESAVGDESKPYAPCVAIAAAKQADVVLSWVLG